MAKRKKTETDPDSAKRTTRRPRSVLQWKANLFSEAAEKPLNRRLLAQIGLTVERPSTRTAVFLALCEATFKNQLTPGAAIDNRQVTYKEIAARVAAQIDQPPERMHDAVRVELSRLAWRAHKRGGIKIETGGSRRDRWARLSVGGSLAVRMDRNMPVSQERALKEAAKRIFETGADGFDAAAHYHLAQSAIEWVVASHVQTKRRAPLEGTEAFELIRKDLQQALSKTDRLFVLSCGTGEGAGECQLLQTLLNETKSSVLDYLCLDLSTVSLPIHVEELKQRFVDQPRLRCAALCEDFNHLDRALSRARELWVGSDDFGADGSCCVVTLFGNLLGNFSQSEFRLLDQLKRFASEHFDFVVLLIGVSSRTNEKGNACRDVYADEWYRWFLETPRYLLTTRRLIASTEEEEFDFNALARRGAIPTIEPDSDYVSQSKKYGAKLVGDEYTFSYRLRGELSLVGSRDANNKLPAGENLVLYTVVKYSIPSLQEALEKMGFDASHTRIMRIDDPASDTPENLESATGRYYTVFSAVVK